MKLLFIGDVVGKRCVEFLSKKLYNVKKSNNIDITVINGENSATGNGITIDSSSSSAASHSPDAVRRSAP